MVYQWRTTVSPAASFYFPTSSSSFFSPFLFLPLPFFLPLTPLCNFSFSQGFVGLVNQAMTCYLNSLLQTLYMTPEFRNAIYDWKFLPKEEGDDAYRQESAKCIPHQLQRLFLLLQVNY